MAGMHRRIIARRDRPKRPNKRRKGLITLGVVAVVLLLLAWFAPAIVMVAQGTKRLLVGGEGYVYDAERFLVTSLDLPANSEVIDASVPEPCVGLVLKLDIRLLAELIAQ